jgi:hypothetical protein
LKEIILLVDYRGAFYSSTTNACSLCSMNVPRLINHFSEHGIKANVLYFPDIDFRKNWTGEVILCQSSEDHELRYRAYIEDMILGLSLVGAHLLPSFPFFRAHHNKVFMEVLRRISRIDEANTLETQMYGTFEDFTKVASFNYPVVLKPGSGAGSSGVQLLKDSKQAKKCVKDISWCGDYLWIIKEIIKRLIRKNYQPYSLYRRKFIIQKFIPDLAYDYKVLIYGRRVFIVRRDVRENDFRASGSGKLNWPKDASEQLLNFAWQLFEAFDVPHASFDIAETESAYHLIEAQFVDFGPATLERSDHHWLRNTTGWERFEGQVELERTFVEGVIRYVNLKGW